jgi:hypothetical protein
MNNYQKKKNFSLEFKVFYELKVEKLYKVLRININYNRYRLLLGEFSALKLGKSERKGLVKPFDETKLSAIE